MQSSIATEDPNTLSTVLAEIAGIDKDIEAAELRTKELKKRREALERIAIEEMETQRLDGVRVAGRSWRVEYDHFMSVPKDRQDALMEVAQTLGWHEGIVSVNTSRLKSLLKELAANAGTDARTPYSEGTPLAGIVSEHVAPKLRHLTVG